MKKIKLKFHSIDYWSRVIFITETNVYLSSLDELYDKDIMGDTKESISEYFKNNITLLTIHGTNLEDDPLGTKPRYDKLEIVNDF